MRPASVTVQNYKGIRLAEVHRRLVPEPGARRAIRAAHRIPGREQPVEVAAGRLPRHLQARRRHACRAIVDPHGDEFLRIESVAEADDKLRVLDLKDAAVRDAVRAFEGGKVTALYESDAARDYA